MRLFRLLAGIAAPAHFLAGANHRWDRHPSPPIVLSPRTMNSDGGVVIEPPPTPTRPEAMGWGDSQAPARAGVDVGVQADSVQIGLAAGTAVGLVLGVIAGFILAGIDQILLLLRFLLEKRNRAAVAAPPGYPGYPGVPGTSGTTR